MFNQHPAQLELTRLLQASQVKVSQTRAVIEALDWESRRCTMSVDFAAWTFVFYFFPSGHATNSTPRSDSISVTLPWTKAPRPLVVVSLQRIAMLFLCLHPQGYSPSSTYILDPTMRINLWVCCVPIQGGSFRHSLLLSDFNFCHTLRQITEMEKYVVL